MSVFRPQDWLDHVLAVGIIAKGLKGAAELVGGVLLLLIPARIQRLALRTANGLSGKAVLFGALHLLWLIVVLLQFIAYQLYWIVLDPIARLIAPTLFDSVLVALTLLSWREHREQRRRSRLVPAGTTL